jgi:hypothetical protein
MKKGKWLLNVMFVLLALFVLFGCDASTSSGNPGSSGSGTTLIVNNQMGSDIIYLYTKLQPAPSWSADWLQGGLTIPAGTSYTWTNVPSGTYDLEADTAGHSFYWVSSNDVFPPGGTFTWNVPVN